MRIKSRVRQWLLSALKSISEKVQKLHYFLLENAEEKIDYTSLSPIANGDENGKYGQALLWALKNRKKEDIKNIALTGPYGSGKSSILKTFQDKYLGNDLKFLNISLATFKDEKIRKDANGDIIEPDKSELLRLIELSILQQIFYFEEDNKIPDSRFKKIKSFGRTRLLLNTFGYSLFVLSLLAIFFPYLIQGSFKDFPFSDTLCDTIFYGSRLIVAFGICGIIYKSIRVINAITLNKVTIQDAEFGLGDNVSKSILNHHIDEILYFFSVRPYNVVIIEDLDRFQETKIFTKLREINLLLNSSKKTKRKEIVFVYAVRDEMFADKDRTKFFDFIIPVIPIINSSNSGNILLDKKQRFGYKLTENFIEDISFYIDDMRLLHNVTNEFYLYKEKLPDGLPEDKLFAIIVYKNKYPSDFAKLNDNDGLIYNVVKAKGAYLQNLMDGIDAQIKKHKDNIRYLEGIHVMEIQQVRSLYVLRILEKLSQFDSFLINGEEVKIDELLTDANFEYVKKMELTFHRYSFNTTNYNYQYANTKINLKFQDIEAIVNPDLSYLDWEKALNDINSNKQNALRISIQGLEKEKIETRKMSLSSLFQSETELDFNVPKEVDPQLSNLLFRAGYIAEDYLDYISLFHEGNLSRADHQFKINVRNRIKTEFDFQLNNIEKLVKQISLADFESIYAFNYSLLDFLLSDPDSNQVHLELIFGKLTNESVVSLDFIEGYLDKGQRPDRFVNYLAKHWSNIWSFVASNPRYDEARKEQIFMLVLRFADVSAISAIAYNFNIKHLFETEGRYIEMVGDDSKMRGLIIELNIKFKKLDLGFISDDLLEFIYKNDYYTINIETLSLMIRRFGVFDQVMFDNSNYQAVRTSQCEGLISYIDGCIDAYFIGVYQKIESNKHEQEFDYLTMLNHKDLKTGSKIELINQVVTKVTDISKIGDKGLAALLCEKNRMLPTWVNLLTLFNDADGLVTSGIVDFINVIENAEELSKSKMPPLVNEQNIYGIFCRKLLNTNEITDIAYGKIVKSSPWHYSDLNIEMLSLEKISALVVNGKISPNKTSFDLLKEHADGLNIALLEKNALVMALVLKTLNFDMDDLLLVLQSDKLSLVMKSNVLGMCDLAEIKADERVVKVLSALVVDHEDVDVSDEVFKMLVMSNFVSVSTRIRLFLRKTDFTVDEIRSFLTKLGGDYALINDDSRRPKFTDDEINRGLLGRLVSLQLISSFPEKDGMRTVYHRLK